MQLSNCKNVNPLISLFALLLNEALCNSDWQPGKEAQKEYLLDKSSTFRNFHEARNFCESLKDDARLPQIMTQEENDAVYSLIRTANSDHAIWLGAKNLYRESKEREKKFLWLDNCEITPNSTAFTNWSKPLFPNYNFDGILMTSWNGKWWNLNYYIRFPVTVCERPLITRRFSYSGIPFIFKLRSQFTNRKKALDQI